MKHKSILFIILSLLLISTVGLGIHAYFSSSKSIVNTFIWGGVNVEVVEEFTPPSELVPGVSFIKDVKVENLGPSECYVRVKAVFTDSDMGDYCSVDFNTTDFVYNAEDGYYYYKDILSVGELTKSLFTTVSLSNNITQEEIKDFDILIYTEAFQSEGFSNYEEAWKYYHRNKPY